MNGLGTELSVFVWSSHRRDGKKEKKNQFNPQFMLLSLQPAENVFSVVA